MPRWGRPPGARMGRHNRGGRAQWEESRRVEEVESEEDEVDAYGRELVRKARAGYMRQLEYGSRGPRRRSDYDEMTDETESVEGGEFDLYDHEDSTVAYAVQLAMRDKEDQLVEKALERIRRAQMLGKKNVRLSQRELDALERKRQKTDNENSSGSRRNNKQTGNATNSRPVSRRNAPLAPEQQSGPYPHFVPDPSWGTGAHGRPSSSSSARPRTPTMQSLRPQQSNSPLRPTYAPYPNSPAGGRPQSMQQPIYSRPLPDDPQWAPPYYTAMPMSPYGPEPPPYPPPLPTDLRVGPQSRMTYPAGMSPIQAQHRQSLDGRHSMGAQPRNGRPGPSESDSEMSSEEEEETESSEEEDNNEEVQIVKVVQRAAPSGVQRRTVSGGSRGSRSGRARKSR
ncbi:uncharacterized protein N7458_007771 [Penicillium daleae]|uniref:Prenylated Rab acceptor 1 n=1 Tax=Penicillium daleae TaxID=63821 RepID=A0AAD6C1V0_9EURO|nr:uncharacterized protein N7458_007771 [Penicillium daleae]KAJ5443899.1 hypothetical protein N7458_007771 [Penicillium daleae]